MSVTSDKAYVLERARQGTFAGVVFCLLLLEGKRLPERKMGTNPSEGVSSEARFCCLSRAIWKEANTIESLGAMPTASCPKAGRRRPDGSVMRTGEIFSKVFRVPDTAEPSRLRSACPERPCRRREF